MNFKAAVAQVDSKVGNLQANIDHHVAYIEQAIEEKADLILFPELSITGYSLRDLAQEIAIDPYSDPILDPLKKVSTKISIVAGFVESGKDHGIYNSAVMFEEGRIKHVHRKNYLPTYGMFEEGRYFSPGKTVRSFDSKLGRFGLLICEDLWHISLPYLLALDGAEVIFGLSASPTRLGSNRAEIELARVNYEHHRSYARLLSIYHFFCNRVGFEDGVSFWGGSAITKPSGETLIQAKQFEEDIIYGMIEGSEVKRSRRQSRHFLDEDMMLTLKELQRLKRKKLPAVGG